MKEKYELFSPEWEKEMMKLSKEVLIMLFKKECMKNFVSDKQIGNHKSPFGIGS